MQSLLNVRTGLMSLALAGGVLVAVGGSKPIVVSAVEADLATALASSGVHLSSPGAGVAAPSGTALTSALDVARGLFGSAGNATAISATLTVDGYRVGDESSPLAIERRSVIAVQITGLNMPPFGGYSADPRPDQDQRNHELVVFVDAATGEFLMAASVR